MPIFPLRESSIFIPEDAVLLDTNVIISAFDEAEDSHEDAGIFVFELGIPLVITLSVVVEAWGLLVGSRKKRSLGRELLAWTATPGNATIVAESSRRFAGVRNLVDKHPRLDFVDAALVSTADMISVQCHLNPPLLIATFDTGDFLRVMATQAFRFRLLDVMNLDEVYI